MTEHEDTIAALEEELEAALSDNDELAFTVGGLEDEVAELRQTIADLRARLAEHGTHEYDESLSYGGTD